MKKTKPLKKRQRKTKKRSKKGRPIFWENLAQGYENETKESAKFLRSKGIRVRVIKVSKEKTVGALTIPALFLLRVPLSQWQRADKLVRVWNR